MDPDELRLLDAVCADLDDSAPRLVYADWLEERGDSRGELIALQHKKPSPRVKKRLKELREAHLPEWLGPLAEFVNPVDVNVKRLADYPVGLLTEVRVYRDGKGRLEGRSRRAGTEAQLEEVVAALGARVTWLTATRG